MASAALPRWMQGLVMDSVHEESARPSTGTTGTALGERLARGESGAFEQVVATCRPRIERLARRLLAWRQDVDDVVQEVFLAVLEKAPRFRGEASLETWLTAITVNKCRSHRRGWLRRMKFLRRTQETSALVEGSSADRGAMSAEMFAKVRGALESLVPADREVVVLYHLEQLPIDQVARVLGVKKNAAEVRLHRARKRLKDLLGDLVDES